MSPRSSSSNDTLTGDICPVIHIKKTAPDSQPIDFASLPPEHLIVPSTNKDPETASIRTHVPFEDLKVGCPIVQAQQVDAEEIWNDLHARIAYITDFLNFSSEDADMITEVAPLVTDMIPEMVDGMYAKLFEFDITKKIFMQRNEGFDGELPKTLDDLTLDSPQIKFRKIFMKNWARRVLTADYSSDKTWTYMDKVGIMHTGVSPFKHQRALGIKPLNVPYRDCALMLGWVQQVLQNSILLVPEDKLSFDRKISAVNAINKIIWIQNDLFSRHYIGE